LHKNQNALQTQNQLPLVFAFAQTRVIGLDEKDKSIVFSMIDIMLTKKKFKDFFQKNVAAL